jgi:hypothetical protein
MDIILLVVPLEVWRDQILTFLSLKELVTVDSATCHKKFRPEFSKRLSGVSCEGNLTHQLDSNALKWLSSREMSMVNMLLCATITDPTFIECGSAFTKTNNCHFSPAASITHLGIVSFAQNSPNLETLSLRNCPNLNSCESIDYLSSNCLKLHSLDLQDCR